MANNKTYTKYSIENFIIDPYFIKLVKNPNTNSDEYWQNVVAVYPGVKPLINKAREIILAIKFDDIMTSPEKELL